MIINKNNIRRLKSVHGRSFPGFGCSGFTLFELIVVITIISVLAFFALGYYRKLLVEVEQSTLEYNLGALRSSLAMTFAGRYISGKNQDLDQLLGSNPMDLLAEKPKNYLGSLGPQQARQAAPGNWYFDSDSRQLIYLVRNSEFFQGGTEENPRIRFKVSPVFSEKMQGMKKNTYISGLELKSVEPYRWLPPNKLQKK